MTIDIHEPGLEALIRERMASSAFRDVDELLALALGAMQETPSSDPVDRRAESLFALAEPLRGLFTDEEVDTMFRRDPSPSRNLDLV